MPRLPAGLQAFLYDELVDALKDETVPTIQRIMPVLTGRLRRSWEAERTRTGGRVLSRVEYAGFVNRGEYAHEVMRAVERTVPDIERRIARAFGRWGRSREGQAYFERRLLGDLPRTIRVKLG
ncbi:hypothetical protein [Candidatus Palauibacter sp.]|uniref:hypothetical protein n=1 Tax=Candidatus Palauibacter sp. TaxID=3101350 RepID=UPI003AF2C770